MGFCGALGILSACRWLTASIHKEAEASSKDGSVRVCGDLIFTISPPRLRLNLLHVTFCSDSLCVCQRLPATSEQKAVSSVEARPGAQAHHKGHPTLQG